VKSIIGDGNCGFRSISWAMTGTERNHKEIRLDVIEYLEESLYQYNLGADGNDWWLIFKDADAVKKHVMEKKEIAANASETEKWAENLDFLAASKMFKINIIVCDKVGETFRWQYYTPKINNSVNFIIYKYNEN
jgi:hypothetical protein